MLVYLENLPLAFPSRSSSSENRIISQYVIVLIVVIHIQSPRFAHAFIMASSIPPGLQCGGLERPVHHREAIIATITDFYKSMIKLPHISPSDLLYPPPGGWPSITPSNFAPARKSNEVIELLKQLPYLRSSPTQGRGEENVIAWDTKPINYREERFQEGRIKEGMEVFTPRKDEFPEWVIPLTRGVDHYGIWLMLDTTDGMAFM
jgi:hypothetical protein